MKHENENMPGFEGEIAQERHERLCAYVFGELQGAERAEFEAELLRSPELQRERERLESTIGLVKRAVPDEGLSLVVRRDLVASARRSRFRFLRGRTLVRVAAAAVLLLGGVFALRTYPGRGSDAVTSEVKVARMAERPEAADRVASLQLAEPAADAPEELSGLGYIDDGAPSAGPSGPATPAPETLDALRALGYSGGPTPPGPEVAEPQAKVEAQLAATSGGEYGTGTPSTFVSRRAGSAGRATKAVKSDPVARALAPAGQAQRPPSDSESAREQLEERIANYLSARVARSGVAGGDAAAKDAFASEPSAPAAQVAAPLVMDGLVGAQEEAREQLDELGYGGDEDSVEAPELDALANRSRARREPVQTREQVAAQVEQLLGATRVAAGEAPSDMFFRYWGDAPFLPADENRTSTFAVDVDTASYALARSYLNSGRLPPREAVRTEEFVNYFKADQPPPADGQPFAIGLELAPSPFAADARGEMLRVTVRGRDVADFERQPLNLTFVIDNSGSMREGDRLELVKRSLALLLRQLYAADSVALVKFSNDAAVVTQSLPAARRGELEAAIQALPIEGGTNVEAGLRKGYELALANLARNAVNRVVLCSDGVGNIGETSANGLLELVKDARAKGIYLNTVGVGMGNHNDAFLEELADKGDGVCNYVDSDAEAKRVFVDGLASLVQPIARDVKIQVEFDPAQVESWRLLGYENRALREQDFRDDKIDAGEVNAGHQVSALYELVRRPSRSGPLATVHLRYKQPFAIDQGKEGERARADAEIALEQERTLPGSDGLAGFASATNGFQRAVLAAQFAEVLRRSVHARADSIGTLLREARRLEKALGDPDFTEFVALLGKANPLLDARAKEETPEVQKLLDELSRLHYEQALRERRRELAAQAGEPALREDELRKAQRLDDETRAAIQRLEAEVRAELYRARGIEPPADTELDKLRELGYARDR